MEKNYKDSKKTLKQTYTLNCSEQHSKKYRIEKHQAMIAYMGSGFKNAWPLN